MEPRSNIEKPKDRKVKRQKNQKTEDMEIIEIIINGGNIVPNTESIAPENPATR